MTHNVPYVMSVCWRDAATSGCSNKHMQFRSNSSSASEAQSHSWFSAFLIRGPQSQIVAEELHDESGIFVRVFCHIVKLCNCILECGACHLASFFWIAQDFILEH